MPTSDFRSPFLSRSLDRFPNAAFFAPIFSRRAAPSALSLPSTNPSAAFFSDFAPLLATAARRLTAPTADVVFDRFGFATPNDFERENGFDDFSGAESLLFENARGARFLLVAPRSTFRLFFDAALGFDVAAICANEALWTRFNADARAPLTPFELDAFSPEFPRFAPLCPLASDDGGPTDEPLDDWRPVSFARAAARGTLDLDDDLVYWERRLIRASNRVFPWTFFVSTRLLASTADAAAEAFSSPRSAPAAERTFEFSVVVERGEATADFWRRLKPGDVLTTNAPANALFLGLLDGEPRFLCRPGLFRGAAAAQIVGEASDGRE